MCHCRSGSAFFRPVSCCLEYVGRLCVGVRWSESVGVEAFLTLQGGKKPEKETLSKRQWHGERLVGVHRRGCGF